MLLFVLLFSSKRMLKWLVITNLLCWAIYYVAVKLSFYSYGEFGNRYCLFFLPVWLVSIFLVAFGIKEIGFKLMYQKKSNRICGYIYMRRKIILGGMIAIAFAYCIIGWDTIKGNWTKEDIRGVVSTWYDVKGYNISTLVYYGALPGFSYYAEHNEEFEEYKKRIYENVVFMDRVFRDKTVTEYEEYFDDLYAGIWPDKLYFVASHISGDNDLATMIQCFTDRGYNSKEIYNANGGKLIYLIAN